MLRREQTLQLPLRDRHADRSQTQNQKIVRGKLDVLELAKQLGNVSQACKVQDHGLLTR